MRCDPQTGMAFSKQRDNTASRSSGQDIFRCTCSGVMAIFVYGGDPDTKDKCKIPQPAAL